MAPRPTRAEQNTCSKLCKVCQDIDCGRYRYNNISGHVNLGKWRHLVQSQSCPFCRLVVRSLTSNPSHMPRNLDDSIVLSNYPSWELAIERSPYDQLNTEAYSNKFDLRSISRKCNRLGYRLVTFSKQSPTEQGYIQYIAPTDYEREDIHFLGRGVNRKEVKTSF